MVRKKLVIAPMRSGDIPEILELEKKAPSAWNEDHFRDELQQPAGFQLVARNEATERIMAVLFGRIVADEAEILKLGVAEFARRAWGYQLLDFAVNYSSTRGVQNCFLELRASNEAARLLYEKRGVVCVGTRKDYYKEPVEDAILMRLEL